MRHQEMKIIFVNKTSLELYLYCKGMPGFILRVSANEHERKDLEEVYYAQYHLPASKTMTLAFGREWKYFDGIKFDQHGMRGHFLTVEETPDETTGEYWVVINLAPN